MEFDTKALNDEGSKGQKITLEDEGFSFLIVFFSSGILMSFCMMSRATVVVLSLSLWLLLLLYVQVEC
jgi:hypothetical protein